MENIIKIAQKIKENGGRLYIVGGAIRDKIIGRKIKDEDYCVTGLTEEEFVNLFPNAKIRGKSFAVFDLNNKEFALARKEIKSGKGHKEFEIETHKNITIQEDLKRRDITINSIAQDVLTKEIIDPFNGVKDIKNKIIRATSQQFKEDPLRVYRVARIAAELEFIVEDKTIELMNTLKEELNTLSKERVFVEFKKALQTSKPSIFFNVLRKADVLQIHFKQIYDLIGSLQPIKYHPEGDSYNHTMIVVDEISKNTNKLEIRYAGLVHDLGKGITPKKMYPHHHGHDIKGVQLVEDLSNKIGVPNTWKKCGKVSAKEHMLGGIFSKMSAKKKVSFIERVSKSVLGIEGLQLVVNADKKRDKEKPNPEANFEHIAKQCLNEINSEYIKKKYGQIIGEDFAKKLHEERVKWMKKIK